MLGDNGQCELVFEKGSVFCREGKGAAAHTHSGCIIHKSQRIMKWAYWHTLAHIGHIGKLANGNGTLRRGPSYMDPGTPRGNAKCCVSPCPCLILTHFLLFLIFHISTSPKHSFSSPISLSIYPIIK